MVISASSLSQQDPRSGRPEGQIGTGIGQAHGAQALSHALPQEVVLVLVVECSVRSMTRLFR